MNALTTGGAPVPATGSGMSGAMIFGVASAGLDLLSGVFGFLTAKNAASIASSRADMIRQEANFNAQRYELQARRFQAQQSVQYAAAGVKLTGSPLDVLDETMRVAQENIASIRRGGEASAFDEELKGMNAMVMGRNTLLNGIVQGADILGKVGYMQQRADYLSLTRNNQGTGMGLQ